MKADNHGNGGADQELGGFRGLGAMTGRHVITSVGLFCLDCDLSGLKIQPTELCIPEPAGGKPNLEF